LSRQNVEAVRRSLEAVTRRDYHAALAPMDEDVVWDDSFSPGGGVHRGWDGVRAATASFFGSWEPGTYDLAIEEYVDAGDAVLVRAVQSGRGRASGVDVRMDHFQVWTFRDGRAVEIRLFHEEEMALAAAGLD
jgi:ketosteroid isomerase-like protein